jgi:hypothetical protein
MDSHEIEQVALARGIATAAHLGQVDKIGVPYVQHPRRVAERLPTARGQAVAWLHDVIEDTRLDAEDLLAAGVDPDVVEGRRPADADGRRHVGRVLLPNRRQSAGALREAGGHRGQHRPAAHGAAR